MMRALAHNAPVLAAAELRALEAASAGAPLMEMAGLAAAELALEMAGDSGRPVLVLAGPGNNGGDAFVLARHLKQRWYAVTVVFAGSEDRLAPDARAALAAWRAAGGGTTATLPASRDWALAVDGIFGIGLAREVAGPYAEWIAALNAGSAPVLALDVPSGIDSDTGRVMGCAVRAARTVTFISLKPGLLTLEGVDHCGEIFVRDLGLAKHAADVAHGRVIGGGIVSEALAPRSRNSHKGHYGSAGIIGGDQGMVGAALLAARAALKLGAGRVYAGLLAGDAPLVDPGQPEVMVRSADAVLKLDSLTALAVGPGLGTLPDAAFYLGWALESSLPMVLDADALNLVAADPEIARRLPSRIAPTVITPHPAEAARLLGTGTREVQADRIAAARTLAAQFKCVVALKGAGTICAGPEGNWHVNVSGNPGLASAGTGDVLTGMIAALLAQGIAPRTALLAAVYLHGAAADRLVARGVGPIGLTAGELIDAARAIVNTHSTTETHGISRKFPGKFDGDQQQ